MLRFEINCCCTYTFNTGLPHVVFYQWIKLGGCRLARNCKLKTLDRIRRGMCVDNTRSADGGGGSWIQGATSRTVKAMFSRRYLLATWFVLRWLGGGGWYLLFCVSLSFASESNKFRMFSMPVCACVLIGWWCWWWWVSVWRDRSRRVSPTVCAPSAPRRSSRVAASLLACAAHADAAQSEGRPPPRTLVILWAGFTALSLRSRSFGIQGVVGRRRRPSPAKRKTFKHIFWSCLALGMLREQIRNETG